MYWSAFTNRSLDLLIRPQIYISPVFVVNIRLDINPLDCLNWSIVSIPVVRTRFKVKKPMTGVLKCLFVIVGRDSPCCCHLKLYLTICNVTSTLFCFDVYDALVIQKRLNQLYESWFLCAVLIWLQLFQCRLKVVDFLRTVYTFQLLRLDQFQDTWLECFGKRRKQFDQNASAG